MGNSSIFTLMGPSGPKGPTAPDGSVGATGNTGNTGSTGPIGATGAGISASDGVTNCNQVLLRNTEGDYFLLGPIGGVTASPNGGINGVICDSCSAGFECPSGGLGGQDKYCCCGTCIPITEPCLPDLGSPCNPRLDINVVGTGASILQGVSGPTASFKSIITDDPDITIQELTNPAGLKISAPAGSGQQSQIVGGTGELVYYGGENYIVGASGTFFKESNGLSAEADSLHAILGDFKELVKRHDPVSEGTVTLDTNEANTHYIVGKNNFKITTATANTNAALPALSAEGVTYGESVNLTMIIKDGGLALEGNPFSNNLNPFKFYKNPSLTTSGTDIVNCISFDKGLNWQCFIAGLDYGVTFSSSEETGIQIGACCTDGECRDYVFGSECEGTLFNRTTCFAEPCSDDRGACCVNGSCFNYSRNKCENIGGNFFLNRECGTFPCPDPCSDLGCCCIDGESVSATPEICNQLGGVVVSETPCVYEDDAGGSIDPCVDFTRGACCQTEECIGGKLPEECRQDGGVHMGAGTACGNVDCCAGQAVPLGICCTSSGCSPSYPVTRLECSEGQWIQGFSNCEICADNVDCDCDVNTTTFRKWRLWIQGITGSINDTLSLLPSSTPTGFVSGATGCDRMSDGYHNTYFDRYDDIEGYDQNSQAMPWAKSFNTDGLGVESFRYIPSISEMAYIVGTNERYNNAFFLDDDTADSPQYWTSTRKEGKKFFTIDESGNSQDFSLDDTSQNKRALVVHRELLDNNDNNEGIFVIGDFVNGKGRYAGIFVTNCSLNLTNHNSPTDNPSYSCANGLEFGFCCTNTTTCSVQNEYSCILDSGGVYFGDNKLADCSIEDASPCQEPEGIETVNCARAGVLSYAVDESTCANGLAEQMYYYAGDINTITGEPFDKDAYNPLGIEVALSGFNISPTNVQNDGSLTQGYCVGHNKVTECTTDLNVLSPNVIAAGTLKAYCEQTKIYGITYGCSDNSVCAGVPSQYDRVIDDCFFTSESGLCGKGLSLDFITLLNENDAATCEQTTWPEDEYFPCGGENCTERIKVWPGTDTSWPNATDDTFKPVFSCEPCLNSFCAYVMKHNTDQAKSWCHRAGVWDGDASALYEEYFDEVFDGNCTEADPGKENPFCGDTVKWEKIESNVPGFGDFNDKDVVNFKASSIECKTRIEDTRNEVLNCEENIEGDYKDLLFVNFRDRAAVGGEEHPDLLNDGTTRQVPGGLAFSFIPVLCPASGSCIAGQQDLPSTIGGAADDARYTALIYGIDDPNNSNESLVGSLDTKLSLCWKGNCIDDELPSRSGSRKQRVENTLTISNPTIPRNGAQLYGLIVTDCQNTALLCRDEDSRAACTECGTPNVIEDFTPPTVGCFDCSTGSCEDKLICAANETLISSCASGDPCELGQCCSDTGCNEFRLHECNADGGIWSIPAGEICESDACNCGDDVRGNCCSVVDGTTTHTYTCEKVCNGVWEIGDNTGLCPSDVGCCYQIEADQFDAEGISSQTYQSGCIQPGDGNDIIYASWTANVPAGACDPPSGSKCNSITTCVVVDALGAVQVLPAGPIIDPSWVEGRGCNPDPCSTTVKCCVGTVLDSDSEGNFDIENAEYTCENAENLIPCFPFDVDDISIPVNTSSRFRLDNAFGEGSCFDDNCDEGDWGYCCHEPDVSQPKICQYNIGEYHCTESLGGTWSQTNSCETCGTSDLVRCCYQVFGTGGPEEDSIRCKYVLPENCNVDHIKSVCNELTILTSFTPQQSGIAPDDAVACDDCEEDHVCCFCSDCPQAQVTFGVCDSYEEPCPTPGMPVGIGSIELSPPDGLCRPDFKLMLCVGDGTECENPYENTGLYTQDNRCGAVSNEDKCCQDVTDRFISGGQFTGFPIGDVSAGETDGLEFYIRTENCVGKHDQKFGTTFNINSLCELGQGGLPADPIVCIF